MFTLVQAAENRWSRQRWRHRLPGLLVILLSVVMAPVNKSAGQPDRKQLELKYQSQR